MFGCRIRFVILSSAILLPASLTVSANTWHLGKDQNWETVSAEGQAKYLLAVAEIKQLVNTGQTEAVRSRLDALKNDFPEITGPDLDAFIEADILFSEGNFVRAVRSYDKFLTEHPESELYEAALDRQFTIATAFLAGQKKRVLGIFEIKGYAEGRKIMEKISDRAGDAPIAVKANIKVANSFEKRGKFDQAYHKWAQIQSRWPTGPTGKNSLLSMARCKHAAYRGPKYDSSNLVSARSYYENFKLRYPKDAEELNVEDRLKLINEQLALKQFDIGRYYQQTGSTQSANLYYQMVVDNWPESTAAKLVEKAMNDRSLSSEKVEK